MISEATRAEIAVNRVEEASAQRVSDLLGKAVFVSLLLLLFFAAIPYGTSETWWKAFFVCWLFATAIFWIIEGYLTSWKTGAGAILLPPVLLAIFASLQTISWSGGSGLEASNAISADVHATRFFVLQLLALILAGAMLFRYATTDRRLRVLTHIIILVCVASAIFAILRQTTQNRFGFVLPLLGPDQGYGQFVNRNHFAFLMEMGFGLTLGMIISGGLKRERLLVYLGALLPIWTALVLSNSRGGLLAMLAQVVSAGLLFAIGLRATTSRSKRARRFQIFLSFPARAAMLVVLIIGVVWGTLWLGGDRLVTRIEDAKEGPVATEVRQNARRGQIWKATWRTFAAHPIAGVGLAGYWSAIPTFHDASGSMTPQEAHNDYLELLSSGGVIGFALGAWFIVAVIRRTRENLRTSTGFRRAAVFGATLGIAGVAVHSLVDFGLHMLANAMVLTALIVIATARVEHHTAEK